MKYRDLILEVYKDIEREPRGNQVEIVNGVLVAFFDKRKKNVALNAPTGIGKSILGGVISGCVDRLDASKKLPSIISMHTNSLARQYAETFETLGRYKYFQIKGAANYNCKFMESQPGSESCTGEECCKKHLHEMEVEKYCTNCEYDEAKKTLNSTSNLVTNFTYFLTAQMVSKHLAPRKLHIFDEAHVFNDSYTSYTEIVVESYLMEKYIKELASCNSKLDSEAADLALLKKKIETNAVDEFNYIAFLEELKTLYATAAEKLDTMATLVKKNDVVVSVKYSKLCGKFENLAYRISHLIEGQFEHVFDRIENKGISVKLIFINDEIGKCLAVRNLFMSATITEGIAFDILGLSKDDTEFITLDPVFPPENKPLFFVGKTALNYNTLKDPGVIDGLKVMTEKICQHHDGQKGLIIAPSFYLGSQVARVVRDRTKMRLFEHIQGGQKLNDLIREFKEYKGAAVLVSPSIFEGLDFKNDESRFQIILKAPFPSLADKRIKYICDNYPQIYQEMTLLKVLQGIGRSIRTPEDFAATYILDSSAARLFNSKINLWKDHYRVMTKG